MTTEGKKAKAAAFVEVLLEAVYLRYSRDVPLRRTGEMQDLRSATEARWQQEAAAADHARKAAELLLELIEEEL